jgi:enoyl-CoA hydratase
VEMAVTQSENRENCVLIERIDQVLVITLNRPQKMNAIDVAMAEGIASAMDTLDQDEGLSVGVLSAAGERFSVGADIQGFLKNGVPRAGGRGFAGIAERPSTKPLIAAVEGVAVGGGFEMALACDLIVAAEGSKFGLPEVKVGLAAAGGGLLRLRRIPSQIAFELNFLGDTVSAERLHSVGLVNRVVPVGQARTVAVELAQRIAANAPLALAAVKKVIARSPSWPYEREWELQGAITTSVTESEDAQEGFKSFLEKRRPVWKRR